MRTKGILRHVALSLVVLAGMPGVATATASQNHDLAAECPHAQRWITAYKKRMKAEVKGFAKIRPRDPGLARTLARRAARDQKVRRALMGLPGAPPKSAVQRMLDVDKANLAWLRRRVDMHGFPTVQQVGLKGVQDAWLLTQHADRDPAFQARVLAGLKPRLVQEPFLRADFAMLTDRVRLAQHRKQLYGSQFSDKNGHFVMSPVEDPAHLAGRRAHMNLMPVDDYLCVIRASYGAEPKKH